MLDNSKQWFNYSLTIVNAKDRVWEGQYNIVFLDDDAESESGKLGRGKKWLKCISF